MALRSPAARTGLATHGADRLGRLAARIVDLALPATCPGCGREGEPLCDGCFAELVARADAAPGLPVGMPSDVPLPLVALEWCVPYAGLGRRSIHALKYGGERRLARPLGRALATRWRGTGLYADVIVPVPVHADRLRERGFDQADAIARVAAETLGLPCVSALERHRATRRQSELGRAERSSNVAGAFTVREREAAAVAGGIVLLVDDVATTGSTLRAAAAALMDAGAVAVAAITVARER
jgi:ComF family protein